MPGRPGAGPGFWGQPRLALGSEAEWRFRLLLTLVKIHKSVEDIGNFRWGKLRFGKFELTALTWQLDK